ncbi:MAG: hypothetical protein K0Q87_4360 [Neobacillus sp.]|nr:hypothetical protein [Neobacillus sp.]
MPTKLTLRTESTGYVLSCFTHLIHWLLRPLGHITLIVSKPEERRCNSASCYKRPESIAITHV